MEQMEFRRGGACPRGAFAEAGFGEGVARLGWAPRWSLDETLEHTAEWYRGYYRGEDMSARSLKQIEEYMGGRRWRQCRSCEGFVRVGWEQMTQDELRQQIMQLVSEYTRQRHAPRKFVPGESVIPPSGKVFGEEEVCSAVDAALDFWLTTGRFNASFERKLAEFLDVRWAVTTNSGSSANLLALAALTSPKLGEAALKPGDEVITVAAGFPTTVNPAVQYGLVPVFVDVDIPTYNIQVDKIEAAITEKTAAIMVAHTLGNPFNLAAVMRIAKKHDLWVIEDCCDALGSRYHGQLVGTFGDIGTLSFYPAHHITMGEGGAVFSNDNQLKVLVESFRDWGRDCWCDPGNDNTCGKRFQWQLGDLPYRLRPQVCVLAHRLQPEDYRLPGGGGAGAAGARGGLHRAAEGELCVSARAAETV